MPPQKKEIKKKRSPLDKSQHTTFPFDILCVKYDDERGKSGIEFDVSLLLFGGF